MELGGGRKIPPLVTFAGTVSVSTQNREEFLGLLSRALAFDARGEAPEFRLANLLAQRKARWLKGGEWEKVSGGAVVLRIYPGGVVGDEDSMLRKMRVGQLQAAAISGMGLAFLD